MRLPAIAFLALALAACGSDDPPPEPQVAESTEATEAAPAEDEATELRDHMQSPIDKAKAVEGLQEDYDSGQADAIEDAEGEPLDDSGGG